tara:strand:+ start:42063 stop:43751 length:1689 start_codon:yes stop_codon:yes gene_type:complete
MIGNSSRKIGGWKKRDWNVIWFESSVNKEGNKFKGTVYISFPPLFIQYGEEEQSPGSFSRFKQENMPIISYTGTEQTLWANEGSSGQGLYGIMVPVVFGREFFALFIPHKDFREMDEILSMVRCNELTLEEVWGEIFRQKSFRKAIDGLNDRNYRSILFTTGDINWATIMLNSRKYKVSAELYRFEQPKEEMQEGSLALHGVMEKWHVNGRKIFWASQAVLTSLNLKRSEIMVSEDPPWGKCAYFQLGMPAPFREKYPSIGVDGIMIESTADERYVWKEGGYQKMVSSPEYISLTQLKHMGLINMNEYLRRMTNLIESSGAKIERMPVYRGTVMVWDGHENKRYKCTWANDGQSHYENICQVDVKAITIRANLRYPEKHQSALYDPVLDCVHPPYSTRREFLIKRYIEECVALGNATEEIYIIATNILRALQNTTMVTIEAKEKPNNAGSNTTNAASTNTPNRNSVKTLHLDTMRLETIRKQYSNGSCISAEPRKSPVPHNRSDGYRGTWVLTKNRIGDEKIYGERVNKAGNRLIKVNRWFKAAEVLGGAPMQSETHIKKWI